MDSKLAEQVQYQVSAPIATGKVSCVNIILKCPGWVEKAVVAAQECSVSAKRGHRVKAKLVFDLPSEAEEHNDALNGSRYKAALEDLDNWLRGLVKYGHEYKTVDDAIDACRDKLRELRDE